MPVNLTQTGLFRRVPDAGESFSSGVADLTAIRAKLNGATGPQYWRSLEEVAQTKEFQEWQHREFPAGAAEWADEVSRRNFLKMAAASLTLAGVNGCTKQPTEKIVPYVRQPEEITLGEPLHYATSFV